MQTLWRVFGEAGALGGQVRFVCGFIRQKIVVEFRTFKLAFKWAVELVYGFGVNRLYAGVMVFVAPARTPLAGAFSGKLFGGRR